MQDILVILVAACAAIYATRWSWRQFTGRGGCAHGTCCTGPAARSARVTGSVASLPVVALARARTRNAPLPASRSPRA